MMEALSSSEISVLPRATWRNIPEDAIFSKITFNLRVSYQLHLQMFVTRLRSWGHRSWLQTRRSRVRFLELPDYFISSGSGTGSTQPREHKWEVAWMKSRHIYPLSIPLAHFRNCVVILYHKIIRVVWRMPSSGKLRRVAVVRTDILVEHIVSIISIYSKRASVTRYCHRCS
jgi:hypothetical protein